MTRGGPPGNRRAATHGAHSLDLVAPEAQELVPQVYELNRHLDERDRATVTRYCIVLAKLSRAYRWLGSDERDFVFEDEAAGKVHPVHDQITRWERQANELEAVLSITPKERLRLGLDHARADSMVKRMQGGRE